LPTIVLPGETVRTTSEDATVLVQPLGAASCCLPGEPLVCRSSRWQQDRGWDRLAAIRLGAWPQHVPPWEDEQQVPPQQQLDVLETVPTQIGLRWPSGQWQVSCGMPAISVITAVSQPEPLQAILPIKAIVRTSSRFIIPFSANLDNPN
jgi:hypothetical protein